MARIGRAAFGGDDSLLAAVLRFLTDEGFRVLGAHEVMQEALGPRGLLSAPRPMRRRWPIPARRGGGARFGRRRCRPVLRRPAGHGAGRRSGGGHRRNADARRSAGATRLWRRAGEAGEARPGPPRRPADDWPGTLAPRRARPARLVFEAGGPSSPSVRHPSPWPTPRGFSCSPGPGTRLRF